MQGSSRALYCRQHEYPDYLPMELVGDDELQLADERPMLSLLSGSRPSYGESLQEDLTVDGLHSEPEVMSWPLLPHSRNT